MSVQLKLWLCNVTHLLSNYVPMWAVTSCSQPLNYQPNTAGNFNALRLGVAKIQYIAPAETDIPNMVWYIYS